MRLFILVQFEIHTLLSHKVPDQKLSCIFEQLIH